MRWDWTRLESIVAFAEIFAAALGAINFAWFPVRVFIVVYPRHPFISGRSTAA